jgi:uncharacterized UBP type Zn finger protein
MDMGFLREHCEFALRRTGGNIEAACNFLFEHDGDIERCVALSIRRSLVS